jgi:hypothetical protein
LWEERSNIQKNNESSFKILEFFDLFILRLNHR